MIQCVTVSDMLVTAVLSTCVCSAFEVFYNDALYYRVFTFYLLVLLTTCVIVMVCLLCSVLYAVGGVCGLDTSWQ